MKRIAFVVPPIALAALLAGCGSDPVQPAPVVVTPAPAPAPAPTVVTVPAPQVVSPAPAVVVAAATLRPGTGRVESVAALPPSAAAGGSSSRRVGIKMEDGTLQYVDTPAQWIALGDRVELTADGQIRRN